MYNKSLEINRNDLTICIHTYVYAIMLQLVLSAFVHIIIKLHRISFWFWFDKSANCDCIHRQQKVNICKIIAPSHQFSSTVNWFMSLLASRNNLKYFRRYFIKYFVIWFHAEQVVTRLVRVVFYVMFSQIVKGLGEVA